MNKPSNVTPISVAAIGSALRYSSEVIPHGCALVSDQHHDIISPIEDTHFEVFPVAAGAKMSDTVRQFENMKGGNLSLFDFHLRNASKAFSLLDRGRVKVICYPASILVVRGSNPEQLVVMGLSDEKDEQKRRILKPHRLSLDKSPPDGTHVILLR